LPPSGGSCASFTLSRMKARTFVARPRTHVLLIDIASSFAISMMNDRVT
jgi:hypothetical protein